MCKGQHHVFCIDGLTEEELDGLRCECGKTVLCRVVCPTCRAVRIEQRPVVMAGLN